MGQARHQISFAPRLLPAPQAAAYLGISQSKLLTLPIRRKVDGGNRLFDRFDLDAYADALPYEATEKENSCDAVFND